MAQRAFDEGRGAAGVAAGAEVRSAGNASDVGIGAAESIGRGTLTSRV